MRILVAGADGRVGRLVSDLARGHGHEVTALGSSLDRSAIGELLPGQEAVVNTLVVDGGAGGRPVQDVSADLVRAMFARGITRLVVASWAGAGSHRGDLTWRRRLGAVLGGEDLEVADLVEGDVMLSELEWTIVRAHGLTARARTGHYRVVEGPVVPKGAGLPRGDLAAFLLKTAESQRFSRRIVSVAR